MPQNRRERILDSFRDKKSRIMVATDVAARGLDVDGITHVVSYDLPDETEVYVHRIGRTGRMGRSGQSWSFVGGDGNGPPRQDCEHMGHAHPSRGCSRAFGGRQEMAKQKDDWDEISDSFGMVKLKLPIGKGEASKLTLADWIQKDTSSRGGHRRDKHRRV